MEILRLTAPRTTTRMVWRTATNRASARTRDSIGLLFFLYHDANGNSVVDGEDDCLTTARGTVDLYYRNADPSLLVAAITAGHNVVEILEDSPAMPFRRLAAGERVVLTWTGQPACSD